MSPRGGEAAGVFISGELLVFDDSFEHEAGAPVETRPLPRVSTAPGLPARRLSRTLSRPQPVPLHVPTGAAKPGRQRERPAGVRAARDSAD